MLFVCDQCLDWVLLVKIQRLVKLCFNVHCMFCEPMFTVQFHFILLFLALWFVSYQRRWWNKDVYITRSCQQVVFHSLGKLLLWHRLKKTGSASSPSNYRPISLTSIFCKLMERIIVCHMLVYCKKNKLISPEQHGFLSKRSTVTNLLECLNDWCCALANRESVVIAYLDFQKAFDSVCHTKLFSRLNDLGISGVLLKFIKNLLLNRTSALVLATNYLILLT